MIESKKIIIVIPAFNVGSLIEKTIKRIPKVLLHKISLVIVNDGSKDDTSRAIIRIKARYKNIFVIDKKFNEGYAKAQKSGFDFALKKSADIIVLLHSDGQYAPEELVRLLQPLEDDEADVVQGSRILGNPLGGGMPLYKYVANRILSVLENLVYGTKIAEFHSGYMLYSKKALETIPYRKLSDTFHFDGEMLIMAALNKLRLKQLPIPTFYGEEKSNVKSIKYGIQVLTIIWDFKRGKYRKLSFVSQNP